ncbi:MAG: hypothetical protein ACPLRM_01330, partial [Anaerolineae bacterium]
IVRTGGDQLPPPNIYPETAVTTLHPTAEVTETLSAGVQSQEGGPGISAWGLHIRTLWRVDKPDAAPDAIRSIAVNLANSLLYMAAGEAIWVMEGQSGQVIARVSLPAAPYGLAVDAARNRVYAALQQMDALAVIDGEQYQLLTIVSGIPGASGVAVGNGHIYVTATRSDELVVVNGQNYAIIKRVPVGAAPYAALYDPGLQRVYVGNAGEDTVSIIDGRDWTLVSLVKLGGLGHPHGLALDPIRERLYVTYALSPKHRAIAVVDTLSGQVASSLQGNKDETLSGAYGIAVDPVRGMVYVTTVDKLLVLISEPLHIVQSIAGIGPAYAWGLATAPLEGRLYIADGQHRRLLAVQ